MKKYIGIIVLGLSVLFFCGLLILLCSLLNGNILWQREFCWIIAVLLIVTGHFLALYRIIDLLEKKTN